MPWQSNGWRARELTDALTINTNDISEMARKIKVGLEMDGTEQAKTIEAMVIPAYQKLIEVLQKYPDDGNYSNWMVRAYGYLAAHEANTKKDYDAAKNYFENILQVDPENSKAKNPLNYWIERRQMMRPNNFGDVYFFMFSWVNGGLLISGGFFNLVS